jgi:hypothetical protein
VTRSDGVYRAYGEQCELYGLARQAGTVVCWDKPGICPGRRPAKDACRYFDEANFRRRVWFWVGCIACATLLSLPLAVALIGFFTA